MQQSKVKALADWPRLTTVTEVQSFLGVAAAQHKCHLTFSLSAYTYISVSVSLVISLLNIYRRLVFPSHRLRIKR
jgi:hypothetical protein